jgi:hypothetical protein
MEKNPIKQLLELAQQREDVERGIRAAVAQARADKHSWQAIANAIGGTKQAAQQRYSGQKAAEQLLADQVAKHHAEDTAKLAEYAAQRETAERDEFGTVPADLGQLPAETAIFLDGTAPAPEDRDANLSDGGRAMQDLYNEQEAGAPEYDWQNPEPRRTAAAPVDVEDDLSRIETGELDTAGNTIDWTGRGAPKCLWCGKTHHYDGKGSKRYFWIGPGCNPTHRDRQFTPEGASK